MVTNTLNGNTMLTVGEVSYMLHVHRNTLRRWSDRGLLRSYRLGSRGDRRYKYEDVSRLLLEQTEAHKHL